MQGKRCTHSRESCLLTGQHLHEYRYFSSSRCTLPQKNAAGQIIKMPLSLSLRRPRDFRVVLLIFFSHCSVVMMHSLNNCLGASGRDTNKWNHAPSNNQRAPAELYSKRFPTDSQVRRPPCSLIEWICLKLKDFIQSVGLRFLKLPEWNA
jgi:hypothetical protein